MASTWIDTTVLQSEPIDLGLDTNGRCRFAVNVRVVRTPSALFDDELVSVLVAGGIPSGSVFVSSKAQLPVGSGPYLLITVTGGDAGIRTHNITSGPSYRRSTAQLLAVGAVKPTTVALAESAIAAVGAIKNQNVS